MADSELAERVVFQWAVRATLFVVALSSSGLGGTAWAGNQNQFGGQSRADATTRLLVLGVERAIESLPVIAGQSVAYRFDPASDAFSRETILGPTVLPTTETVEPGVFSLQVGASYFELSDSFGPVDYLFTPPDDLPVVAKIGMTAQARVGLVNTALTYGLFKRVEVGVAIPVAIVEAQADQIYSTFANELGVPADESDIVGVRVRAGDVDAARSRLNADLEPGRPLALRREAFRSLNFAFNEGTHFGLGRVAMSGKVRLLSSGPVHVSAASSLLLPSPNEEQFAGAESVAIAPRVIAAYAPAEVIRLIADVGYSYDFEHAELRRFNWSVGGSVAFERLAVDVGMGGAELDRGIRWTPQRVQGEEATSGEALASTTTDTSLVSVLLGARVRISERLSVVGGWTVPVIRPELQPKVLGTLGLEATF